MVKGLCAVLSISTINDLIDELENGETSLSNVRNLAALYNVKTHLLGSNRYDSTVKELNDIFPSYLQYVETKRKYQLKEVTDETIYVDMKELCREIKEFIQTLYSSTDTEKERELIKQMIKEIH